MTAARLHASTLLAASACAVACVAPRDLVDRVAAASTPTHLPRVVACWEKLVEATHTEGGAVAVIDFTVEAGTSKIKDARVTSTRAAPGTDGAAGPSETDLTELATCVQDALNRSTLPVSDGASGPGFSTDVEVRVKNFRLAFVDASTKGRRLAEQRESHILVGPRADRCQGLYGHEPPRDASTLYAEIASEQGRARIHEQGDQDLFARALHKLYDLQVELRTRLVLDLSAEGLPAANRKRMEKALRETEAKAVETGARIGCEVPRR